MPRHEEPTGRLPRPGVEEPSAVLARFRRLLLAMVAAIMAGGGLDGLAELASAEVSAPVAIIVPRLGEGLAPPQALDPEELSRLRRYVRARVAKRPAELPEIIARETPITTGDELVGAVVLLAHGRPSAAAESADVLNVAAIATLSELAVAAVREETEEALRSSLIELIRGNPD